MASKIFFLLLIFYELRKGHLSSKSSSNLPSCCNSINFDNVLHHFDILMETLSLLLTNVAKIRGKFAEVAVQVVHFNAHSAPKVLQAKKKLLHQLYIIVSPLITKEVMDHFRKCFPSSSLNDIHCNHKILLPEQRSDLRQIKYPCFFLLIAKAMKG